jgi:hypothetical protein
MFISFCSCAVRQARANMARAGLSHVEFRLGEIECLPVEANTVDVVISKCVCICVVCTPTRTVLSPCPCLVSHTGRVFADMCAQPTPQQLRDQPVACEGQGAEGGVPCAEAGRSVSRL